MSFEGSPINQEVHKERFIRDFGRSIRAHRLLERIPTASSWNMYQIKTSHGEALACLGIVMPGNTTRILTLGFATTGEIVGFSSNEVSPSRGNRQKLLSYGIIGSSQTGWEYGTAMEVVRQHELGLYARRTGLPIEHTVRDTTQSNIDQRERTVGRGINPEFDAATDHWEATQGAWDSLYAQGTYGYKNNRRSYLPTEERIVPEATLEQREHGFVIELKKRANRRSWKVKQSNGAMAFCKKLGLNNPQVVINEMTKYR